MRVKLKSKTENVQNYMVLARIREMGVKLVVGKFLGILFFEGDHNILRLQP